jgi:nitrate/nitrite transporter NarK
MRPGRALASTLSTTTAAYLPAFLVGGLAVQMRADLALGAAGVGVAVGTAIPAAAMLGGLAVPAIALTAGWRWAFLVLSGVDAGFSEAGAGLLLTVGSIAGIGVRLLVGLLADRRTGRTLVVMAVMFSIASLSFVLLATETRALFLLGTPLAFATAYAWPGLFQLAAVRSNPSAPGVATGVATTGTLAGAVAGPVVFGTIAASGSYAAAWSTRAALLVAAVIVALASRVIDECGQPPSAAAVVRSTRG